MPLDGWPGLHEVQVCHASVDRNPHWRTCTHVDSKGFYCVCVCHHTTMGQWKPLCTYAQTLVHEWTAGQMEGWVCVSSVPAPGPCPTQIQRKMTQIYGLIGIPGAKAQPSLAGTRHSIAKRKRGLANEPVLPDPACHLFPAWFSWSQLRRGNGGSGWERLSGEGRGLWRVRGFPELPASSPATTDTQPPEEPLEDPPDSQEAAQVHEDGVGRHTGRSWPDELGGGPRAGLHQGVRICIKEHRGFQSSGDP